jgi:hypothetical protein
MRVRSLARKKAAHKRRSGKSRAYKVSVLFIEDSVGWSAQALEYDIATQADTLEKLFHEVERILVGYVALANADGHPPFEGIPPAPQRYWEVFRNSKISMTRPLIGFKPTKSRVPRIETDIRLAERIAA